MVQARLTLVIVFSIVFLWIILLWSLKQFLPDPKRFRLPQLARAWPAGLSDRSHLLISSNRPPIHPSTHPSVHLSIRPTIHPSISSICMVNYSAWPIRVVESIHPSLHPPTYTSTRPSI